jgi:RNA polymerase sigma factor (sigma-70 family)
MDALDQLVTAWHNRLWRYVRTLLPTDDAAGEAIQNAWLGILRGLPKLRDPMRFRSWAYRIAHRVAMDQLRLKYADARNQPLQSLDDEASVLLSASEPDLDAEGEGEMEMLQSSLMELQVVERTVLGLFYLQELSLAEIATVIDVPLGTVKSRLFRARRMLRQALNTKATETTHV